MLNIFVVVIKVISPTEPTAAAPPTKAALVMLFYMHLKYETKWYSLVLVFPLFMVTVLFVIVLIAAASWNIV